ncbi:hypothetical protein [Lysinibacillus xylanilyticus]|uniref:hypothetical protein n=1 Tax=Lysinibacillus xylanilyticus TaxID=582475 RepID=UPI00083C9777|nr:hypothetical protein [Lysinibacillus xylanilyticus]
MADKIAQLIPVTRDLTLGGTQRITTNFKAKSVEIKAFIPNTKITSHGFWAEDGTQRVHFTDVNGGSLGSNTVIYFINTDTTNTTRAMLNNIDDTGFDLVWDVVGTPYSGNAVLLISIHGHGGDI